MALALTVAACSGGDDDDDAGDTDSSTAEFERASVELAVERADLVSPHAARGPLDAGTRDAVAGVVEKLLLVASAQPLVEGKAGGGFADLFMPEAGERAANTDRSAFFDEADEVGERFGAIDTKTATVSMTALAGMADPATKLVVVSFRWDVTSKERPADRIFREGELSLIPVDGTWKIGAYTVVVRRTIGGSTTTTTADSEEGSG